MLEHWLDCSGCGLSAFRRQVVIGRGSVPADILFIGEAPGKTEDLRGLPFVGRSGKLLNQIIEEAGQQAGLTNLPTYYITNVVGCRPTDSQHGPNRQPTGEEALACWPRLEEVHKLVKPKLVVFIGKVSKTFCSSAFPQGYHLVHPAYLLRIGGARSPEYANCVREMGEIFRTCMKTAKIKKVK